MKNSKVFKIVGVFILTLVMSFVFVGCAINKNQLTQQELFNNAWGLVQTARAKLQMNYDGVRDNLVIKSTYGQESDEIVFYKTQSGDYIYKTSYMFYYEDVGQLTKGVYTYDSGSNRRRKLEDAHMESVIISDDVFNFTDYFNKESITKVQVQSDDNYKVTLVSNQLGEINRLPESMICEMVITQNAKIISIKFSVVGLYDENISYVQLNALMEFKYGGVDMQAIITELAEAKACAVTNG